MKKNLLIIVAILLLSLLPYKIRAGNLNLSHSICADSTNASLTAIDANYIVPASKKGNWNMVLSVIGSGKDSFLSGTFNAVADSGIKVNVKLTNLLPNTWYKFILTATFKKLAIGKLDTGIWYDSFKTLPLYVGKIDTTNKDTVSNPKDTTTGKDTVTNPKDTTRLPKDTTHVPKDTIKVIIGLPLNYNDIIRNDWPIEQSTVKKDSIIKPKDTIVVTPVSKPKPEIWIPDAFTPNGDGINDTFKPVTIDIAEYKMLIYNRWGTLVSSGQYWTGENNENNMYICMISATGTNHEKFYLKKAIYLVK